MGLEGKGGTDTGPCGKRWGIGQDLGVRFSDMRKLATLKGLYMEGQWECEDRFKLGVRILTDFLHPA